MLRRFLALLVLASLVLAACGGDDGDGAEGGGDGGEATQGDVGIFDAAECAEVAAAMAAAAQAMPGVMSGSAADVEQSIEQFQAFADVAPDEIRDDMQTLAEGYARIAQVLADADFDPTSGQPPSPETLAALEAASQELNTDEFTAAAERVSAYFESGCGG
jgi:hypothetical protein